MYRDYFGFKEDPFSIAPDPHFLYMSERHREALAHLLYGMDSGGGFVLLTGDVGAGKTTICRCLLDQVPADVDVAFILNPMLTVPELLATVCDEFGLVYPAGNQSVKVFVDAINDFLLAGHAKGRRAVLIIDEAQNLHPGVLEQVRLLTNLETNERKLLQIILLGQPELLKMLARPELLQLAQRVTARYHLGPLSHREVEAYVAHRLAVAGIRQALFPRATLTTLYRLSQGVPRLINVICDRALLGTYVLGHERVRPATLKTAAREVLGNKLVAAYSRRSAARRTYLLAILLVLVAAYGATLYWPTLTGNLGLCLGPPMVASTPGAVVAPVAPAPVDLAPEPSSLADTPAPVVTVPLTWPPSLAVENSKAMAFSALFARWDGTYEVVEHGEACGHAEQFGLCCLFGRGSLGSLRFYNRPAVLQLYDAQRRPFFAALVGLDDATATLVVGNEEQCVALRDLEDAWLGEFTILWQAPVGYQGSFRLGDQGASVAWLAEKLAQVQGREARLGDAPVFDDEIQRQVLEFQLTQGLQDDGIAGPRTLIRLNDLTGGRGPRLAVQTTEGSDVLYP